MQIILDIITCVLLAMIPAAFNYFFDYCVGHPMSDEISTKAILFRYSYFLAKRALPEEKYKQLVAGFAPLLNNDDPDKRKDGKDQLKKAVMISGRKHFFYEQAIGMCPFCTNFWVCQACSLLFYFTIPLAFINPLFYFIMIPIFSHTYLRKL